MLSAHQLNLFHGMHLFFRKSEGDEDHKLNLPPECDICHLRFKNRKSIGKHKKVMLLSLL